MILNNWWCYIVKLVSTILSYDCSIIPYHIENIYTRKIKKCSKKMFLIHIQFCMLTLKINNRNIIVNICYIQFQRQRNVLLRSVFCFWWRHVLGDGRRGLSWSPGSWSRHHTHGSVPNLQSSADAGPKGPQRDRNCLVRCIPISSWLQRFFFSSYSWRFLRCKLKYNYWSLLVRCQLIYFLF